jgi:flagellar protein FlaG
MAMEAISNVGAVSQIPEIQKQERATQAVEAGVQGQEHPDVAVGTQPAQSASAPKPDTQQSEENGFSFTPTRQERTKEQIDAENKRVKEAISEMNKKMFNNSEAVFGIHEDTNRITIKIVDKTTKKTIKELPPEKTLDMIAKAWELAGLMVDERG